MFKANNRYQKLAVDQRTILIGPNVEANQSYIGL